MELVGGFATAPKNAENFADEREEGKREMEI